MNIFIDIETIPNQTKGTLAEHIGNIKPPAQYKKPDSIQKWLADNRGDEGEKSWLKTSLSGNEGEIICICFCTDDGQVHKVFRHLNESEEMLLLDFNTRLFSFLKKRGHTNKPYFIGHNVRGFDLPFIFKRMVVNNVKPIFEVKPYGRHGSDMYDTMEAWEGFNGKIKLDKLAKILGIQGKTDGMDGSKVWGEVKAGNIKKVVDYCADDVLLTRAVYNRLTFNG